MNDFMALPAPPVAIAVVERDTGLSKDTLRVWERRYGFPMPLRDMNGERVYPADQVEKLRLLRRLMDNGHRPGKIVARPVHELLLLADELGAARDDEAGSPDVEAAVGLIIELIRSHDTEALRQELARSLMRVGLEQFVLRMAAPLTEAVGEAWARGQLQVFEEHLFTAQLSDLLRQAIHAMPRPTGQPVNGIARPRVLLTTFPQEQHMLGLMMAEAMFTMNGCACVSLGAQTPLLDIVQAAQAHRADIVALSFSSCMNTSQVVDGLLVLHDRLGADLEIWAGGGSAALGQRALRDLPRLRIMQQLSVIDESLAAWATRRTALSA